MAKERPTAETHIRKKAETDRDFWLGQYATLARRTKKLTDGLHPVRSWLNETGERPDDADEETF